MKKTYLVTWQIDIDADSPMDAAIEAWTCYMQRSLPVSKNDACVFNVEWMQDDVPESADIDLSDIGDLAEQA